MSTWFKVTLVIVAILLLLAGIASFLAYRRLSSSRTRFVEEGKEFRHVGEVFGHGKSPAACVDESVRRLRETSGFRAELRARLFLEGCLPASNTEPAFCEAIPRQLEVAQAGEWTVNECRQRDAAEIPRCSRVLLEVVRYCDASRRNSDAGTGGQARP